MKVDFIDPTREWNFFEKEIFERIHQFGNDGSYILGKYLEDFENNFAKFLGYKFAVGVGSGLSALYISLLANNIGNGDEVITVSNSAVATALAISHTGAKPIFCDIRDDFLINPNLIESLITKNTKAILPVHLFGKICDMKKINTIAKKHNIKVIEDACQAHGSNFAKESLINTKAFSFYPTKNLGGYGEGGLILTNDKRVKEFTCTFRNYGQSGRYNHIIKGVNERMDALQAVILNIKLKELSSLIKKRQNIANKYCCFIKNKYIAVPEFDKNSSYHLFVIIVSGKQRDNLQKYLLDKGIYTLIHYPTLIHKQSCYKEYHDISLKKSEAIQLEILSLPCYPFLNTEEQEYIINTINNFCV